MGIEEMFAEMGSALGSDGGVFFTGGVYKVELNEVEYRPNGYKGKSVFFRFKVLESGNAEHPVGSTRVWILKLGKKPDEDKRTMADIKNLIFALTGTTLKEVGSPEQNPKAHKDATNLFLAACDKAYAEKNKIDHDALIGRECNLECQDVKTAKGNPFTRHVWTPADE